MLKIQPASGYNVGFLHFQLANCNYLSAIWTVTLCLLIMMVGVDTTPAEAETGNSTMDDWAVMAGFALEADSTGFQLPTAIAFVPEPGDGPDDPLYFVTQLRGEIKVVTNDRSVHTFASVPTFDSKRDDLQGAGQQGLAGICLDPQNGHVFVTFPYPDQGHVLRNSIVRFTTTPITFGLSPESTLDLSGLLADFQSAPAHQIGGCAIHGESLFVSIGDGGNVAAAKNPDMLLGKILCITLNGEPCPDNPFREAGNAPEPADYVWAHGFRNPFGIQIVNNEVYIVENGIGFDRFLKAERGQDHHWDGTDQSIATGAILGFPPPGPAPVQLAFVPEDTAFLPEEFANHFVFAAFGKEMTGVMAFGYDFENVRVTNVPKYILEHHGNRPQHVLGVAVGPDGLYIVPGIPDAQGKSAILKMYYDPDHEHSVVMGRGAGVDLLAKHGCISCHAVKGRGGGIGPSLDRFGLSWRLTERLNSQAYKEMVARMDELEEEPFVSFRNARREVLAAVGQERTRIWLKHFVLEPRFDNPDVQMPNPGLTEAEAEAIRNELYGAPAEVSLTGRVLEGVQRSPRAVAFGFASGVGTSILLALVLVGIYYASRKLRRTRRKQS